MMQYITGHFEFIENDFSNTYTEVYYNNLLEIGQNM